MAASALHLIARPSGEPKDRDFELRPIPANELADGQARVRIRYVSVDPVMRIWMTEQKSYRPPIGLGEDMRAGGIGEVVESKNQRSAVGVDIIEGIARFPDALRRLLAGKNDGKQVLKL